MLEEILQNNLLPLFVKRIFLVFFFFGLLAIISQFIRTCNRVVSKKDYKKIKKIDEDPLYKICYNRQPYRKEEEE